MTSKTRSNRLQSSKPSAVSDACHAIGNCPTSEQNAFCKESQRGQWWCADFFGSSLFPPVWIGRDCMHWCHTHHTLTPDPMGMISRTDLTPAAFLKVFIYW